MEQFLEELRAYAAALGIKPATVVQKAECGGGTTWGRWEVRESSPTLFTVDKIRAYMAANPAPAPEGGAGETAEAAE